MQVARLAGVVRLDLARRQSAAERRRSRPASATFSARRRSRFLQPRTAIAWQFAPNTVLRAGFGVFSDLLPGSVADLVGANPPYVQYISGRPAGHRGRNGNRARRAQQRHRCHGRREPELRCRIRAGRAFLRFAAWPIRQLACRRLRSPPFPSGKLHAPYFMQWSLGLEHQFGNSGSLQAQYVGTRAVDQPYLHAGQRIPDGVSRAALRRFLTAADRSALRRGHAIHRPAPNSHYNGLQLTADEAARARLAGPDQLHLEPLHRLRFPTADSCRSPRREFSRHCPAILRATTALAITTFATTSRRSMSISCRSKSEAELSAMQ